MLEVRVQPAQGSAPQEPFVHIAHQHVCVRESYVEQPEQALHLLSAFPGLEPEISGYHLQALAVGLQGYINGAACLLPGHTRFIQAQTVFQVCIDELSEYALAQDIHGFLRKPADGVLRQQYDYFRPFFLLQPLTQRFAHLVCSKILSLDID